MGRGESAAAEMPPEIAARFDSMEDFETHTASVMTEIRERHERDYQEVKDKILAHVEELRAASESGSVLFSARSVARATGEHIVDVAETLAQMAFVEHSIKPARTSGSKGQRSHLMYMPLA